MPNLTPAQMSSELRMKALTEYPAELRHKPEYNDSPALGVLMETGLNGGVVTLVAFITGDASIYFSTGGGILGGQGQPETRIAARRFVQFAGMHVPEMSKCTEYPLPTIGQTTFYVITSNGIYTLSAPDQDLGKGLHDFSPLFHVGHSVIGYLRRTIENKK